MTRDEYLATQKTMTPADYKRVGAIIVTARPQKKLQAGEKLPSERIDPKRTFAQKAVTFAKSSIRHVAHLLPQATDEQVAERFAICEICPHYISKSEGYGECRKCGCGLKAVGISGLNKLRWADESCPIGKWKEVS